MKDLKIIKKIKEIRRNKYQYSEISLTESKKIKKIKSKIYSFYKNLKKQESHLNLISKDDITLNMFNEIYSKKKINSKDKVFIEKMYHKYNSNLKLKAEYNDDYVSMTQKNTNILSYIYLGLIIKPNKQINFLQILNMILKISDHVIISFGNIKSQIVKRMFCILLDKEKKYLKKINQ